VRAHGVRDPARLLDPAYFVSLCDEEPGRAESRGQSDEREKDVLVP
jgi:hypothetical protein